MKEKYFADIHASKESQFFGGPAGVEDTPEIAGLREKIALSPEDCELYLELGGLLNFQLRFREAIEVYTRAIAIAPDEMRAYRQRAPRYITTLQFDRAYADFKRCEDMGGVTLDTSYRLGLCKYFMGEYEAAEDIFLVCAELAKDDAEMLAAVVYWRIMCRCKQGKDIPPLPEFGGEISHHAGYRDAVGLFDGSVSAVELRANAALYEDGMNAPIALYGLANFYLHESNRAESERLIREIVGDDTYWMCFTYIAAWVEWRAGSD